MFQPNVIPCMRPRGSLLLFLLLFNASVIIASCESETVPTNTNNKHQEDPHRDLIVNGDVVSVANRFPYYASVQWNNDHLCGGTLVAPNIVLTAAHCELAMNFVVIGQPGDPGGIERIGIEDAIQHPLFHYHHQIFDQMILVLKRPSSRPFVNLNMNQYSPSTTGEALLVIGTGDTIRGNRGSRPNNELHQLVVEYVAQNECKAHPFVLDPLTDDLMCVITETSDGGGCNGDSGGPILKLGTTAAQDVQMAIVSLGFMCNYDVAPGIGSRTSFSSFIQQTVCEKSVEPKPQFCNPLSGVENFAKTIEVPDDAAPTCKAVMKECDIHAECCSKRCVGGACRSSPSNTRSSRTALGRASGVRGGSAARKRNG